MTYIAEDQADITLPHLDIKKPVVVLIALITGCILALIVLAHLFMGRHTNFEEAAAMGAETTAVMSQVAGYPINCHDNRDAANCIAGVKARHAKRSIVWFGNSQLDTVNQWKPGEPSATPILFHLLKPNHFDLVTFNQPNASLEEHYVLFEYLRRKLPIHTLILPVCFDDTREEGLRSDIRTLMNDQETVHALAQTAIGRQLLSAPSEVLAGSDQDTAGITNTLQERAEKRLNAWLAGHSALWQARPQMRGTLLNNLY